MTLAEVGEPLEAPTTQAAVWVGPGGDVAGSHRPVKDTIVILKSRGVSSGEVKHLAILVTSTPVSACHLAMHDGCFTCLRANKRVSRRTDILSIVPLTSP